MTYEDKASYVSTTPCREDPLKLITIYLHTTRQIQKIIHNTYTLNKKTHVSCSVCFVCTCFVWEGPLKLIHSALTLYKKNIIHHPQFIYYLQNTCHIPSALYVHVSFGRIRSNQYTIHLHENKKNTIHNTQCTYTLKGKYNIEYTIHTHSTRQNTGRVPSALYVHVSFERAPAFEGQSEVDQPSPQHLQHTHVHTAFWVLSRWHNTHTRTRIILSLVTMSPETYTQSIPTFFTVTRTIHTRMHTRFCTQDSESFHWDTSNTETYAMSRPSSHARRILNFVIGHLQYRNIHATSRLSSLRHLQYTNTYTQYPKFLHRYTYNI